MALLALPCPLYHRDGTWKLGKGLWLAYIQSFMTPEGIRAVMPSDDTKWLYIGSIGSTYVTV